MRSGMIVLLLCIQLPVCQTSHGADVKLAGFLSGNVVETNDKIIVDGATFVAENGDAPAINIGKSEKNREVILSNVRIISNNPHVTDDKGSGAIVVIDNSKSKSKVSIRNVKVMTRNAKVSSVSKAKLACAAIICVNQGKHDTARKLVAEVSGKTNISVVQGERPDYRKMPPR